MAATELFSKVSRRIWSDEKFCSLSAPAPNARDLWLYLLTGPHNGAIPGLFELGELALAEKLDWEPDPTRSCLQEVLDRNMARFDRKRRLFWLPNAIVHNLPRSPKQVTGWAKAWKLLPECALLTEAAATIRAHLAAKSHKFADAFDRVVAGLVDAVDHAESPDDGEDPPDPSAPAEAGLLDASLSNRNRSLYPAEPADPMRFQEKEKEKEKEKWSPTETTSARARGGAAPGKESAAGERPTLTVASELTRGRVPESDEERAVLQFLLATPSLRHIATDAFACHVAEHCAEGPHTGRLRLEDILHALDAAGRAEAAQSAAAGLPRDQRKLAGYVMGFVRNTKLGDGARAAAAEPEDGGAAAESFLDRFDAAWAKSKHGKVRAHASGDLDHAGKVVVLAEQASCRLNDKTTAEQVENHWIREHLRSQDKFVLDADHALRMLPGRVDTYGLPRNQAAHRPPPPPRMPARGAKPPPDMAAFANSFGRVADPSSTPGGNR